MTRRVIDDLLTVTVLHNDDEVFLCYEVLDVGDDVRVDQAFQQLGLSLARLLLLAGQAFQHHFFGDEAPARLLAANKEGCAEAASSDKGFLRVRILVV
jgi:hypothetical protein